MNWDKRIEEVREFNRRYRWAFALFGYLAYGFTMLWAMLLLRWLVQWLVN